MSEQLFNNQFEQTKSIDEVSMSLRLNQLLKSKDINTLQDIVTKGKTYFSKEHIAGFAPKDFKELETILSENNMQF